MLRFEMQKVIQNPVAWVALLIVLVLNAIMILIGEPGTSYSAQFPVSAAVLREWQEKPFPSTIRNGRAMDWIG